MRIACPSCNAVYQVPDAQLSEGRVVRCVRCATDWLPVVAVPAAGGVEPVVEAVAEPGAGPMAEPARDVQAELEPEVPVRRMALDEGLVGEAIAGAPVQAKVAVAVPTVRRGPWLAIAWVVSILAVGGGVAALGVWREAVMAAWPPSVRGYAVLGLVARP